MDYVDFSGTTPGAATPGMDSRISNNLVGGGDFPESYTSEQYLRAK